MLRVPLARPLSMAWLRALARIAQAGGMGAVRSFDGEGRTPAGRGMRFAWRRGRSLTLWPARGVRNPGAICFRGRLDFETVNRLRNFPLCDLLADAPWLEIAQQRKGDRS